MPKKKVVAEELQVEPLFKNRIIGTENIDPRTLIPNPDNIKDHPEYQHKVMRNILEEVGWISTIIVNKNTGHIIDGHMRVEDAIAQGEKSVPVTYVDLDEETEKKALLLFDPVSGLAKQNTERLSRIVQSVQIQKASAADFVRSIAKKHKIDTDRYTDTGDEEINESVKLDDEDTDNSIHEGDVFEIANPRLGLTHRLICGNSSDKKVWDTLLDGVQPVLCVTSPPYNQNINTFKPSGMQLENTAWVDRMANSYLDEMSEPEYQVWQVQMINMICGYLTENGSLFYNHKLRYREKTIVSPLEWILKTNYKVRQEIIWDRGGSITLNAKMFIPCDERIYWIRVGDEFIWNDETEIKSWSTVWKFGAKNDVRISAAFPFELPYRCILACSKPGNAVVDPYSGSGTTIVAANRTKRNGYGIELSPKWVEESLKRFETEGMIVRQV